MSNLQSLEAYQNTLEEIASEQAAILEQFAGSKERYFESRGVTFPKEQEERGKLVNYFLNQDVPDPEAALLMFDPVQDADNIRWIRFLWDRFAKKDSPLHNPERAFPFALQGAHLGESRLNLILASYYEAGLNGAPLDQAEALYWYEKAFEVYPDAKIGNSIVRIYRDTLGLQSTEIHDFSPDIIKVILKSAEVDSENIQSGTLKYIAACLLAQGYKVERNEALAIHYYEELIENPSAINFFPLRALVIRYALGLGVDADLEKAQALLKDNPNMRCDCIGYYEPLEELLEHLHEQEYLDSVHYIQSVYKTEDATTTILDDLVEGRIKPTKANVLVLNAMKILCRTESWNSTNSWLSAFYYMRLTHHGFNPKEVMRDTWRLGPYYNVVSDTGLPILGVYVVKTFRTPDISI